MSKNFAFPKKVRLLKKSLFQTTSSHKQLLTGKYFVFHYHPNKLAYPRLGIIISKRKCRLAVWRNRLKRQVREAFRYYQSRLFHYDIVVVVRQGAQEACKNELRQCLDSLFLKLICAVQ